MAGGNHGKTAQDVRGEISPHAWERCHRGVRSCDGDRWFVLNPGAMRGLVFCVGGFGLSKPVDIPALTILTQLSATSLPSEFGTNMPI